MQEFFDWISKYWPILTVVSILFAAIVLTVVTFILEEVSQKKNKAEVFVENN